MLSIIVATGSGNCERRDVPEVKPPGGIAEVTGGNDSFKSYLGNVKNYGNHRSIGQLLTTRYAAAAGKPSIP